MFWFDFLFDSPESGIFTVGPGQQFLETVANHRGAAHRERVGDLRIHGHRFTRRNRGKGLSETDNITGSHDAMVRRDCLKQIK